MLKGVRTTEDFDAFVKGGLCKEHRTELEVKDDSQSTELQRKALLYIRLQIFSPLVFEKAFSSEKIKTVFAKSKYFPDRENRGKAFKEAIMVLDSVVAYTLCYFGKICCAGALYQTNVPHSISEPQKKFLHGVLNKRNLESSDISHFSPILQENFSDCDENLTKMSYVVTLLFVRNTTMNMTIMQAINRLDTDMQIILKEGEKWENIALDAYKQKLYEEAVEAYTSALYYNSYNVSLLNKRAQVYMKLKQYEDSILDYYILVMLKPKSVKAFCKLASAYLHLGSKYESYSVAEYALEKFKDCKFTKFKIQKSLQKVIEAAELSNKEALPEKSSSETSSGEEEVEIPDLIEASDSEHETQDVPDLMDASNSEESGSESMSDAVTDAPSSNVFNEKDGMEASKIGEQIRSEQQDRHLSDELSKTKNSEYNDKDEKVKQLTSTLKEASLTLLDGCGVTAVPHFCTALNAIKSYPEIYKFEECEVISIKYAYGIALCKSKSRDDLQKAISIFKELIEEHNTVTFPASHYGIGLAYFKLNCFKDALNYLKLVNTIISQEIPFKVHNWPGLTTPINETNCEHLKSVANDLIKECENPPPPDAMCRFEKCSLRPAIYYTDPDFKGYYTVECSEHCCLQYHSQCWRILRSSKHCTDKAFLEQKCYTPDCEGIVRKIQSICKEGSIGKTFLIADTKKLAKPKKSKLEKKLEIKEGKRRRRKDSTSKSESASEVTEIIDEMYCDNTPENETDDAPKEPKNDASSPEIKEKDENSNVSVISQLSANAEPFIILKKEKFVDENPNKVSTKAKEHKRIKNNTLSIDEFLQHSDTYCSEYGQRLNELRENNENIIQNTWTSSNKRGDVTFGVTNLHCHALVGRPSIQPVSTNFLQSADIEGNAFNATSSLYDTSIATDVIECVKTEIYVYMKDMLNKYGPLRVDAPIIIDELKDFPPIANKVIADCDGIGGFLKQNIDFALVGDTYVCLVTDVIAAYEKYNKECTAASFDVDDDKTLNNSHTYNGEDSDFFHSSHLNPDAKEYLPSNSNGTITKSKTKEIDRNSPQLISAISKLRQPLTVDTEINSNSNEEAVKTLIDFSDAKDCTGCLTSKSSSYSKNLSTKHSFSQEKVTEVLEKCTEAIKMYFSDEMNPHHQFINECLKPFCIVEISKKNNVCIQTEIGQVQKESKGTMKTDEELIRLKEIITVMHDDKKSYLHKLKIMEEERNSCLDSAIKNQKEADVEISILKSELEVEKLTLEKQMEEFKSRENKFEEECQFLLKRLEKTEETNSDQKCEIDQISADKESVNAELKEMKEVVNSLRNEKTSLKESLDLQVVDLSDRVKALEAENREVLERAKYAERLLLCLKKSEFIRRIDCKALEATQRMKQLQEGISMISANLNPVVIENIRTLLSQMKDYLVKLQDIRKKFVVQMDEQINQVNNGTPLKEMRPIETELPEIPSFTSLPHPNAALNSQAECWTAQVQKLNSAYNSTDPNSFLHPQGSNMLAKTKVVDSQSCQPKQILPTPVPLVSSNLVKEKDKSVPVPNVPKLPPGISAYNIAPQVLHNSQAVMNSTVGTSKQNSNILASFPIDSQPSVKPQVGNMKQNETASVKNISPAASQTLGAAVKDSVAATAKDARKYEKAHASSSLELDYNVKKLEAKKLVPSAGVSQENLERGRKNKYEKLLRKLRMKFPEYEQKDLMDFVDVIRAQTGKLTGRSIDDILNEVASLIESKRRRSESLGPVKSHQSQNAVLVNKKLVPDETQSKDQVSEVPNQKKCPWAVSDGSKQWSGSNTDKECTICFEDYMMHPPYKVDCGHIFHFKCIQQWLSKKSDCPICRLHLLLPDDYPAL